MAEQDAGNNLTGNLALCVNLGIAIMKGVARVLTGSGAMLSEAAHSVADTFTELFLLTALRRSTKPADRRNPFAELDEILLDPIPHTDPELRERVLARYGALTPRPENPDNTST
jgi:hypothetical protein